MKSIRNISLLTAFYNAPGHVYWKNKHGIYLGCNVNQAATLGLSSPDEIIGKNDFELLWKDGAVIFRKNDLYVISSGNAEVIEEQLIINNIPTTYLSHKVPLVNKHKNVVGVFGISVDISVQKKVETYRTSHNQIAGCEHVNAAFTSLSPRELQVLKLLAAGKPRKAISKEVNLSVKTVDTYRARMFDKLHIKNDIELMHFIIRNNLRHLIPWL